MITTPAYVTPLPDRARRLAGQWAGRHAGVGLDAMRVTSRYATRAEALSDEFMGYNRALDGPSVSFDLPDHFEVNQARYPWALASLSRPQFYASRLWEYPWALSEASLSPEHVCADIGCGQSPLTIYLQ